MFTGSASHRRRSRSDSALRSPPRRGGGLVDACERHDERRAVTSAGDGSSSAGGRRGWNSKPGVMKSSVRPASGAPLAIVSRTRTGGRSDREHARRRFDALPRRGATEYRSPWMRVLLDPLGLQRPERVEPDVQGHVLDVQARRARSGVKWSPAVGAAAEPLLARVDGLVALGVVERACDVRRERRRPPARRRAGRASGPRRGARAARLPVAARRRAAAASAARAPPTRPVAERARPAAPRHAAARSGSAPATTRVSFDDRERLDDSSVGRSLKHVVRDVAGRAR